MVPDWIIGDELPEPQVTDMTTVDDGEQQTVIPISLLPRLSKLLSPWSYMYVKSIMELITFCWDLLATEIKLVM